MKLTRIVPITFSFLSLLAIGCQDTVEKQPEENKAVETNSIASIKAK